jgi:PAS domain S-box-containing protein
MKQRTVRATLLRFIFILAVQTILIISGIILVSIGLIQQSVVVRQELLISSLVAQGNLFLTHTEQVAQNTAHLLQVVDEQEQVAILDQMRLDYPRFVSVALLDVNGRVMLESTDTTPLLGLDLSGEPFFQEARQTNRVHFSDPFISLSTGQAALITAVPVQQNNQFNGVLIGEISLGLLQQEVIEQANLGTDTTSFIVDRQGTLLAHPNPDWVQERRNLANVPLVATGLSGLTDVSLFYDQALGGWLVGSVQHMAPGWPVITLQPVWQAAEPIRTILLVAIVAFILSLLLFLIFLNRTAHHLGQPLATLVARANALAQGNFAQSLITSPPDRIIELDSLNQAFTQMAVAVQERDHTLASQLQEIKKIEAQTRQTQAFLNSIVEHIPNIIFVKDAQTLNYYLINQATEEIVGVQRDLILGKSDADLFPLESADEFVAKDREVLAEGVMLDVPEEVVYTSSGPRKFHTKKVPILDETGKPIFLLGISEDITERLKVEEQLKTYAAELERSNRELQDFAYVSSHDLQEPLRKIQTFTDRILQTQNAHLDARGLDYMLRIQQAASRMQALIVDLLAYSRVMSRNTPFYQVDLNVILQDVLMNLEVQIEDVGGIVRVEPLPTIAADENQMRQLFQNLVSNALKYHQANTPPVVEVSATQQENGWWYLFVADNGIGFDEIYLDRIFTVFQRLHSREAYDGTGVGLAICRRIVERHGGSITATSKPGVGTTFIVTLPPVQPTAVG